MQELPGNVWIHIGECPVCVDGLCRVRVCRGSGTEDDDSVPAPHLYAMCDECEATWIQPDTSSPRTFPDADNPLCPICSAPLYGQQAAWARPQDLEHTDWEAEVIFDVASSEANGDPKVNDGDDQ